MNVVWFKRDLRLQDHNALSGALQGEKVLLLYILEPELWQQPDLSGRHFEFLRECLIDLKQRCAALNGELMIRVGEVIEVLQAIHQNTPIENLWSHQETWNNWTYQRDIRVGQWCQKNKIQWHEPPQNGVVRRLRSRDGWAKQWKQFMAASCAPTPYSLPPCPIVLESDPIPTAKSLTIADDRCPERQHGGRARAERALFTFLNERGEGYTKEMSSPESAFMACSRLSVHFAFGTMSIREAYQAHLRRTAEIKMLPSSQRGKWPSAMVSFSKRLHWHCHFIQKLEDEPSIEWRNLHPGYDDLRPAEPNEAHFQAWRDGKTGWPLIDACMRALTQTGWINFRMRAMLMSVASYHLWMDWPAPALHLARLFTDYEPGIHYNQCQMQSGTTGINTMRIYSPTKQALDQDPEGDFIRRYIPEIAHLPNTLIHTPWIAKEIVDDYPEPILDEKQARKAAADKMYARKKEIGNDFIKQEIVKKHASRQS